MEISKCGSMQKKTKQNQKTKTKKENQPPPPKKKALMLENQEIHVNDMYMYNFY